MSIRNHDSKTVFIETPDTNNKEVYY